MTAPRRHVVTLAVFVRLAQQVVAWDPEQARVPLERLSHDLQDAVQELRVLAHGVYLLVLMDRGLVAAFESAAGRASLRVLVVGGRRGAVLPGGMGWGLLLLPGGVPETRPSTPARARGVAVTIERRAERLSFTVADNGRRVRPDGSSGGCHGCVSISDRVGAIGRGARGRLGVPPGTRVSGVRIWGPHSVQHGFVARCEGKGIVRKIQFDSSEVVMRLLKRHPDEPDADELGGEEGAFEDRRVQGPAEESVEPGRQSPTGRRWGRRTVTVPMTVPERSVRRTVTIPSRSLERSSSWRSVSLGPLLAIAAGAALAVVGSVALVRTGIDGTWFRPRTEVLDADHTALLGALEIGAGLLLLLGGLTGSRVLVAILGLAMALGATAVAIEPQELQRELAIERWWAWTLAAAGVVLALAALQAPRQHHKTVVDVP